MPKDDSMPESELPERDGTVMPIDETQPGERLYAVESVIFVPGEHKVATTVGAFHFWNGKGAAPYNLARALVLEGHAKCPELPPLSPDEADAAATKK